MHLRCASDPDREFVSSPSFYVSLGQRNMHAVEMLM